MVLPIYRGGWFGVVKLQNLSKALWATWGAGEARSCSVSSNGASAVMLHESFSKMNFRASSAPAKRVVQGASDVFTAIVVLKTNFRASSAPAKRVVAACLRRARVTFSLR